MSEKGKPLTLGPDQLIFGRDIVKEPAKELAKESEKRPAKRPNIRPRFLHRARAEAQKLGLKPRDDYEAIDLLKERGIDILAGAPNVLPVMHLPANPAASQVMPNVTPVDNQERMREIARIQRDLVRRRRRRLAILMVKLAFFVFLPTAIAGWYFARGATPMYETFSEFVIQKADPAAGSAMTGLLAGTALATAQDSMIVQGYLTSREAMQRLDHDHGFRAHFSNPAIDPIQRLPADASEEAAYKLYKNQVTVGFDTTEGILRMSVIAATPEISQQFSEALVGYAEERVDQISQRVREGQMKGARESYDEAEAALKEAQRRMLALQEQRGVLSTEIEVSSQMSLINPMQLEVENKQLELQELMTESAPQCHQGRAAAG